MLGLVCERMTERIALTRQEEEDRRVRQEVYIIAQGSLRDESPDEENTVDTDGFPDHREIWNVTHEREEDLRGTCLEWS